MSHHLLRANDMRGSSIDPLSRDVIPVRSRAYGLDDISGYVSRDEPLIGGVTAGVSVRGYSPRDDPILMSHRRDVPLGISSVAPGNADMIYERPSSQIRVDGPPLHGRESNILFVDGLPADCTRREVGHIFRPFIGYKDIKVIHKEPRRTGDKAMVLCFVEFNDSKCALTAMDALQGYKFDDKKPESSIIRIHFAHFPFRLPSETQ
ncbi:RNA-binding protein 1-like [Amaranthus tricolor]|uniref:RNA-binding protein 1-like n=1 Tax=Amaranthus tricolor TaxID=29722 RepID=UPI00258B410F|nr:RNA-binding protein 1-like [Amaranthus tricolor]XP_057539782.1 RNA-binding protein 1-like [Amaranthus tricolor]